jgi:hypothetical protein
MSLTQAAAHLNLFAKYVPGQPMGRMRVEKFLLDVGVTVPYPSNELVAFGKRMTEA